MKSAVFAIALLFTVGAPCLAAAPTSEAVDAFSVQVSELVKKKDFDGIRSLYDFTETPQAIIDKTMMIWQARVTQPDVPDWTFAGVEYFPMDEFLARPGIDKATVEAYVGEQIVAGITYVPNIEVAGLLAVKFTSGMSGSDFLYPVGISPDGKLCFVGRKPKG